MEILFAATELAPFVKVGGLADVVAALPKALRSLGHSVTLVLPRFPAFEEQGLLVARRLTPIKLGDVDVTVFDGRLASQVDIVLVDAPPLFDKPHFYGDDAERRTQAFSGAIVEIARQRAQSGRPFDIVHLHDWPVALAAELLRDAAKETAELRATKCVLTIHNAAYQGVLRALERGIAAADAVTTVSPTYARELLAPSTGHGLDALFREKAPAGILNGVDYGVWNPATDAALPTRFDPEDISGRVRSRGVLLKELGFPLGSEAPILGFVGRLVDQKGVDLILGALPQIMRASDALVVLCGDGDEAQVGAVEDARRKFEGRVVFVRAAPEKLVHRLFGGADFIMVPSRHEPCGLVQLYAQRYGAPPIAHATGGIVDTVVDCDASLETGSGFLFSEPTADALGAAILRALAARAQPSFSRLIRRVMRLDRSWDGPARRYESVFRNLIKTRG
jgi:starch synthase